MSERRNSGLHLSCNSTKIHRYANSCEEIGPENSEGHRKILLIYATQVLVANWIVHSRTNIASHLQLTLNPMTFQRPEDASSIQDPSARFAVLLCENGEGTDHWDPKMRQKQFANFSPNKQRTRRTLISSAKKKKNNFVERKAPTRPKAVGSFCKKKTANPNKLFHCNHERYGEREGE
jgi:hypothetical protein